MNRIALTLLLLPLFPAFAQAQEIAVPQTQRPLITKRTASWCPLCGGWGWTFFRNLLDDNAGKAVFFADHYDGVHTTPTSLAIAANFGGVSQPIFFLNNQNQNVSSGNTATARTNIRNQVNDAFASQPVVQSGIRPVLHSAANMLSVQAKARFFQNAAGEYYLGIYLVRKEMTGFQSGQGNNAEHKEVLWRHLTSSVFGEPIGNGAISAGTEFNVTGQVSVAGLDPSQLRVVTVVWRKDGNTYQVINTNEEDSFLEPSGAGELARLDRFEVFPTIIYGAEPARVELQVADNAYAWRLELLSASGQAIETLFSGKLPAGLHPFYVKRENRPAGIYFLRLTDGRGVRVERLVFK